MKILKYVLCSIIILSLSSCVAVAHEYEDDIYVETSVGPKVNVDIIIKYGVPFYRDGILLYYIYNDRYYYPRYHNRRIYDFDLHRRPIMSRPIPQHQRRPSEIHNRPSQMNRQRIPKQSNPNHNHGHFGGRR